MSKVLVIGGAGYIGAHICQSLVDNGYSVRIFDDFSNGLHRRIEGKFTDLVEASVLDRSVLISAMDGIDSVIHLAAKKAVEESVSNPLKYYEHNVGGTLNILAAMAVKKVKKIVFSSTAAVYAPSEKSAIDETDLLAPLSPYGATKVMAEELIKSVGVAEGFSTISLRYFNVVGSTKVEFADNSKDNLVLVEFSKNKFAIVISRKEGTFLIGRLITSLKASAVLNISSISFFVKSLIPITWSTLKLSIIFLGKKYYFIFSFYFLPFHRNSF